VVFRHFILDFWKVVPVIVFLLFVTPIFIVLSSLFGEYSENWSHIYEYVLSEYLVNSLILVLGVSFFVLIIGVITAWLVSNYDFTGKNIFEWALILPLAIPPYILAYTFTGLFDSYGSANNLVRNIFFLENDFIFFPNVRNIYGAILVLSFTLYPYVYLASRMAFINQSTSLLDVGRTLGLNRISVFLKLGIPLIRPAIIGGLLLVIMETLSDFGAVEHFAVATFTTGIFRTWYGMYDLATAMQLSSVLLLFILVILALERYSRKKAAYTPSSSSFKALKKQQLKGYKNLLAILVCFLPIFIGFLLPVSELINWTLSYKLDFFDSKFMKDFFNTIFLSLTTALFCCFLAFLITFSIRLRGTNLLYVLNSFLSLGYGVPGLILAVGILQFFTFLDRSFFAYFPSFVLTGSILGLILAYLIKAYALANNSIESGFLRVNKSFDDVSKTLGNSGFKLLGRVHFPLLRTSFLTAFLLVFAEVIKELPATLILRPFNFDTLAVSAYIYASEERMYEAAAPSIAIVLAGLLPIIILSRIIRDSRPGSQKNEG
tara:strand:+ start:2100 stop:3737 length:1638 start_codon:yes stop_codon:yes gene_type:complete